MRLRPCILAAIPEADKRLGKRMERSKIRRRREAECSLYWAAPSMGEGKRTNEMDEAGAKRGENLNEFQTSFKRIDVEE